MLGNRHFDLILVFFVFFGSLLQPILNAFENNLGQFLVFWDCFNIYIFFKPNLLKIY
jgi:hypothetical protein